MLIDSLKFSREKQTTRGMLPVAELGRLRDSLFAAAVHTPELGNVVSPSSSNTVVMWSLAVRTHLSGRYCD